MRILGLDIGDKRIGVALSDPEGLIGMALTVVTRVDEQTDLQAVLNLITEHEVQHIVVGLPRSMDGTIGKQAEKVQAFCRMLAESTELPIDTWDERLSTVAAERAMVETGVKRARRKKRRDAVAAAIILQEYLDWRKNQR